MNQIPRLIQAMAPPIPERGKGESEKKFMGRCMSSDVMNREYPDEKKRAAICHSQAEAMAGEFPICAEQCELTIQAASGDGGEKVPRFSLKAYSGGELKLDFWLYPVVVDLKGMQIPSQKRPVRSQHNPSDGIGHTTSITIVGGDQPSLIASGIVSRDTPVAKEFVASAGKGFPWQASIGARAVEGKTELVDDDVTKTVNGREFTGPFYHVKESVLGEISIVDLGADGDTEVSIAARLARGKETAMTPEEIAAAAKEKAEAEEEAKIEAAAEKKKADEEAAEKAKIEAEAAKNKPPVEPDLSTTETIRAEALAETKRIAGVRKICGESHGDILTKAIEEGWNVEKAELEVLRASRPKPVAAGSTDLGTNPTLVLEAAAVMSMKHGLGKEAFKGYDEQTLDAAQKAFGGRLGLQELLLEAARANGFSSRNWRDTKEMLRYGFRPEICAAGFSTIDISGILSNVANKFLLAGFDMVEQVWREIAGIRSVNDFKQVTSYRLIGTEIYQEVNPAGEIKHADLGEEEFANRAATYGLMMGLTRTDIINDDMGALSDVPRKLGRGAGLKINDVFWTAFLNDATFFTAARGNLITGAAGALSIAGLTLAEIAFMALTDPEGNPIGHIPVTMLVPPALNALAAQLMRSVELREEGTTNVYGTTNPHAGKFTVKMSRYLTAGSATAWYIFCSPADLAPIEICFLNGVQEPTVETADADFNQLGIQLRGYHDFGVAKQDYRAGIKITGVAVPGS